MEIKNAIITDFSLNFTERGILDFWIYLDYECGSQGFGGYALYLPKSFKNHKLKSYAGHYIYRVLEVAGVTDLKDLKGKTIRVNGDFSKIESIGHIIKNIWFNPKDELI